MGTEQAALSSLENRLQGIGLSVVGIIWLSLVVADLYGRGAKPLTAVLVLALIMTPFIVAKVGIVLLGFALALCWLAFNGAYDVLHLHWAIAALFAFPLIPLLAISELMGWVGRRVDQRAKSVLA